MKGCTLFLVALILAVIKNGESLNVVYMDTIKNPFNVDCLGYGSSSSGILKSNNLFSYRTNWDRTLILTTASSCGIVVSVREIDFRPNKVDNLTISDLNSLKPDAVFSNPYNSRQRFYDPFEYKSYIFPSGQVRVRFMTGPYIISTGYNGFELIFTAYKKSIFCSRSEFKCDMGCISSSLACDGHNHCGNRADQFNCNYPIKRNVAAIVCGVVFLLIAVACVIFIIIRRASRSGTETTVISHPPPAYPPPGTYYPPPPPAYTQYSQGQTNPGFR